MSDAELPAHRRAPKPPSDDGLGGYGAEENVGVEAFTRSSENPPPPPPPVYAPEPAPRATYTGPVPMMEFGEAVREWWHNVFVFSGRSTRAAYWWPTLALGAGMFLLGVVTVVLAGLTSSSSSMSFVGVAFLLLMVVASIAVGVSTIGLVVRRFHDVGLSGWWYLGGILVSTIPFVGWLASIAVFVITVLPSQGPNQYGEPYGYSR